MPISRSDQLFALIKSLTKAEKRNFKIYAQRISDADDLQYLRLFDLLDKQKELDEVELKGQFPIRQLPNLKRHLYSQLMTTLRMLYIKKQTPIQIREYLDFSNVLYGKGLYLQSLKLLKKAKSLADKTSQDILALDILEFEKIIESRHITRTGPGVVTELTQETDQRISKVTKIMKLSNFRLLMHGWYIRNGHIKSAADAALIKSYLVENKSLEIDQSYGLVEKAYYYQSYVWYHYILLDFKNCLKYAKRWVDLFHDENKGKSRNVSLLLRGYHYLLTAAYNLKQIDIYNKYLVEIETFRKENYSSFDKNIQIMSFLYVHNGRLNKFILEKDFNGGLDAIPRTLKRISRYGKNLDNHRILVFYYKIAWIYLMAKQPDKAIKYLHKIIQTKMGNLREDIQGYARLAFIMAHFDQKNYDLLTYLVKDVSNFLEKSSVHTAMHKRVLSFFRNINNRPQADWKEAFRKFKKELEKIQKDKYERRGFLYLDIISWVEEKC